MQIKKMIKILKISILDACKKKKIKVVRNNHIENIIANFDYNS